MTASAPSFAPRVFYGCRVGRRRFADIVHTAELMSNLSRHELAHAICEHPGWRAGSGEDGAYSALGMLETLEQEGFPILPAKD